MQEKSQTDFWGLCARYNTTSTSDQFSDHLAPLRPGDTLALTISALSLTNEACLSACGFMLSALPARPVHEHRDVVGHILASISNE